MCEHCKPAPVPLPPSLLNCPPDPEAVYHEDQQPYVAPRGIVSEDGLKAVNRFLVGLTNAVDAPPIPFATWERAFLYSPCRDGWISHSNTDIAGQPFRGLVSAEQYQQFRSLRDTPRLLAGETPQQREANLTLYIKQTHRWLSDRTGERLPPLNIEKLLTYVGDAWLIGGNGENVGTFPKRVAKCLYKEYGHRLTPQQTETLGNIASAAVAKNTDHSLSFDQGFTDDGSAEEYCNEDSCWWGDEREGVREAYAEEGGYMVREWDEDDDPISRACIIWNNPQKCYVVFNAYGRLSLPAFARLLSLKWGLSYVKVTLRNKGDYTEKLYINGGTGYAICSPAQAARLEADTIDLDIEEPTSGPTCCACGYEVDEDDSYYDNNGDCYCSECYSDRYTSCERCGEEHTLDGDDLHDCNGSQYCERCARRTGFAECACCNEWVRGTEETPDGNRCEGCCDEFTRCDECETLCRPSDMTTTEDGRHHCSDCYVEPEEEEEEEEEQPEPSPVTQASNPSRTCPYHLTWGASHGVLMSRID